jgi:alcohol dehydrogenase class IV
MDFSFLMPTHVIFCKNCIAKNKSEFGKLGHRAFIVTGKASALKSGALEDVVKSLSYCSIPFLVYNGVLPNPNITNVREAALMARDFKADMIIGIGGGSPMDAAKAVSILAKQDLDDEALFKGGYTVKPLPVIAIPTTAGTGSEVTPYSILTDEKDETKKNLSHESLYPKIAFLDPSYTTMLPYEITVNTAIDAFSHAVESCLSKKANPMSIMISLESLKFMGPCLFNLCSDKMVSLDNRESLLYASMLAGIAISQTGTTVVHAMGYSLTYFKKIDHGKANGLLLCEYLRYVSHQNSHKIKQILEALNMKNLYELECMIDKLLLKPEPLSEKEIDLFSQKAVLAKSVANTLPVPMIDEIKSLYRASLGSDINTYENC